MHCPLTFCCIQDFPCRLFLLCTCTASIPVRFTRPIYSVTEGVDSNAIITLEALTDHPSYGFDVTVLTQDGSAIRKSLPSLIQCMVLYNCICTHGNAVISYSCSNHFMYTTNKGDSDYTGESFSVTFPAGVNMVTFNVPIINDGIAELAESFTLDLEIPAASAALAVTRGSPDNVTVNIIDDEG